MADVEVPSWDEFNEARGEQIVGGHINGSGSLVLETRGGDEINAGQAIPAALFAWPIGSVYISMVPTSPATLLGGGTWQRVAKGRMLMSVDEANTRWDAAGEVGGSVTATLNASNIPKLDPIPFNTGTESAFHRHTVGTNNTGGHEHGYVGAGSVVEAALGGGTGAIVSVMVNPTNKTTTGGGGHDHNMTTSNQDTGHSHTADPVAIGEDNPASIDKMPPYVATYIWQRTA